jgi:hypothetical protein
MPQGYHFAVIKCVGMNKEYELTLRASSVGMNVITEQSKCGGPYQ